MNLAKRKNGIYYVQYFDEKNNRVRRISTGEKLKKNALIFISEFRAQNKINGRPQYISLRNFRDEYIEYIKKTFSKKYLSSVELSFRLLIRFTNDLPLQQIE